MSTHLLYNYLLTTYYGIRKQPVFSAIKIFSLTLGLVCALLVLAHVQYIYSYDRHFPNWQNTYRVIMNTGGEHNMTSDPYAERLAQDYAQIEYVARARPATATFYRGNTSSSEASSNSFFWVDPSIVDLFSLDIIQGDKSTALIEANAIVLSETTARKYFGDEDPIGQILTFGGLADLQVTGVMRDLPVNTYLEIEAMIPVATGQLINGLSFMNGAWGGYSGTQTFLSVSSKADAVAMENDFDEFLNRNMPDESRAFADLSLSLEPLSEVYLSHLRGYNSGGPFRATVFYGLIIFAFLILLASCVNYTNLSMAQLQQRGKEIGVRKAIGANRSQIMMQFLFESMTLTLLALVLAVPIVRTAVPVYTSLTETAFTFSDMLQFDRLYGLLLFVLVTAMVSGLLPALTTARIQPAQIVKGAWSKGKLGRNVRSAITVFQFSLSNTLIILALSIVFLIEHLNEMEIGFNRFDLVVLDHGFDLQQRRADYDGWETRNTALNSDLTRHGAVIAISETTVAPPNSGWESRFRRSQWSIDEARLTNVIGVDENYIETLQLQLVAGRGLSQEFPADFISGVNGDSERIYGALIPRSSVGEFDFESAEQALGEILHWTSVGYTFRIVGVVEDFRFAGGLENTQGSTGVMFGTHQPGLYTLLRVDPLQVSSALEHIDNVWARHRPGTPVNRWFFEQTYDQAIYDKTNGINRASLFAALITISIAAMGLYALAYYATQRRIKEVGLRKTLGATTQSLIGLLTWDFVKPVAIACLISWFTGYLAVMYFFSQFSSYPEISIGVYIAVAASTIALAVFTVSAQCFKAANANPVQSLRFE